MAHYIALAHPNDSGGYGILFPDFPGCIGGGDNFDAAYRNAAEALSFHVESMENDRNSIPAPRNLSEIMAAGEDWIDWEDAIVTSIPLVHTSGTVRINISLDRAIVDRIDGVTNNRSSFLANAALRELEGQAAEKPAG